MVFVGTIFASKAKERGFLSYMGQQNCLRFQHGLTKLVVLFIHLLIVGAFSGRIGLPPAVTGWAASCDGGPWCF